jgi:hypothetical protein
MFIKIIIKTKLKTRKKSRIPMKKKEGAEKSKK